MIAALAVVLVFSIVVVIHELGHFLVCRWLGVRVETFAVGFGKELIGFDWKGTRWSFCLLPLGGYVKPAGEELESSSGAPDEFFGQSWYRRIAIALAGPVMNYLLAFICFFFLVFFWGQARPSTEPIIGETVAGFPAQAAGLMKGDRILAIDGKGVSSWEDAAKEIHSHPEQPIDIHVQRASAAGTEEKIVALVPKKDPQRGLGLVGISPMIEMIPQTFSASVRMAGDQTYFWTRTTLVYLRDAIVNRKKPELAGPLGIVTIVAKVSKEGLQEMVGLIALISLSLGLFNFFPIPMLDGGHVFLYFIEGITRRPLNQKFVRVANLTGAALLLAVFVFATSQDLSRLNLTRFWK